MDQETDLIDEMEEDKLEEITKKIKNYVQPLPPDEVIDQFDELLDDDNLSSDNLDDKKELNQTDKIEEFRNLEASNLENGISEQSDYAMSSGCLPEPDSEPNLLSPEVDEHPLLPELCSELTNEEDDDDEVGDEDEDDMLTAESQLDPPLRLLNTDADEAEASNGIDGDSDAAIQEIDSELAGELEDAQSELEEPINESQRAKPNLTDQRSNTKKDIINVPDDLNDDGDNDAEDDELIDEEIPDDDEEIDEEEELQEQKPNGTQQYNNNLSKVKLDLNRIALLNRNQPGASTMTTINSINGAKAGPSGQNSNLYTLNAIPGASSGTMDGGIPANATFHAGYHSSNAGRKPALGQSCSLRTLVADGILQAGREVLTIEYMGTKFIGDLRRDGTIVMRGPDGLAHVYATPSAWANHCCKLLNPDNKPGSAWSAIRFKGKRLDSFKLKWYRKQKKPQVVDNSTAHLVSSLMNNSGNARNSLQLNSLQGGTTMSSPQLFGHNFMPYPAGGRQGSAGGSQIHLPGLPSPTNFDLRMAQQQQERGSYRASPAQHIFQQQKLISQHQINRPSASTSGLAKNSSPSLVQQKLHIHNPLTLSTSGSGVVQIGTKNDNQNQNQNNSNIFMRDNGHLRNKKLIEMMLLGQHVNQMDQDCIDVVNKSISYSDFDIAKIAAIAKQKLPPAPPTPLPDETNANVKSGGTKIKTKLNHHCGIVTYEMLGARNNNNSISMNSSTCSQSTVVHNPNVMVKCVPFSAIDRLQPFNVTVSTNALLLIDFHSHLVDTEVVGYLAGTWDLNQHHLTITQAFPCRTKSETSLTQVKDNSVNSCAPISVDQVGKIENIEENELDDKDLEKVEEKQVEGEKTEIKDQDKSQVEKLENRDEKIDDLLLEDEIRQEIERKKLTLVGWYHSHQGKYSNHPTLKDIQRQLDYQITMKESTGGYLPCVGLICSPHDLRTKNDFTPTFQMYWVMPPAEHLANHYGRPMQMIFSVVRDLFLTQDLLLEMRLLANHYQESPDMINFQSKYPYLLSGSSTDNEEEIQFTYLDKLSRSVKPKLPKDLQESEYPDEPDIWKAAVDHFWKFLKNLVVEPSASDNPAPVAVTPQESDIKDENKISEATALTDGKDQVSDVKMDTSCEFDANGGAENDKVKQPNGHNKSSKDDDQSQQQNSVPDEDAIETNMDTVTHK